MDNTIYQKNPEKLHFLDLRREKKENWIPLALMHAANSSDQQVVRERREKTLYGGKTLTFLLLLL